MFLFSFRRSQKETQPSVKLLHCSVLFLCFFFWSCLRNLTWYLHRDCAATKRQTWIFFSLCVRLRKQKVCTATSRNIWCKNSSLWLFRKSVWQQNCPVCIVYVQWNSIKTWTFKLPLVVTRNFLCKYRDSISFFLHLICKKRKTRYLVWCGNVGRVCALRARCDWLTAREWASSIDKEEQDLRVLHYGQSHITCTSKWSFFHHCGIQGNYRLHFLCFVCFPEAIRVTGASACQNAIRRMLERGWNIDVVRTEFQNATSVGCELSQIEKCAGTDEHIFAFPLPKKASKD